MIVAEAVNSPRLSEEEMKQRCPNEWAYIADAVFDSRTNQVSGTILFHSPDREAFDQFLINNPGASKNAAVLFLGDAPASMRFAL